MQIKFLQTSTSLACLAVVTLSCQPDLVWSMDYCEQLDLQHAVEAGVYRAGQRLKAEEDKERREREYDAYLHHYHAQGKLTPGEEKTKEKKELTAQVKQRELKDTEKSPQAMSEFELIMNSLEVKDIKLWKEWDSERNMDQHRKCVRSGGVRQRFKVYNDEYYWKLPVEETNKWGGKEMAVGSTFGCKITDLATSPLGIERLQDLKYFMEHLEDVPNEIRSYKEERERIRKRDYNPFEYKGPKEKHRCIIN